MESFTPQLIAGKPSRDAKSTLELGYEVALSVLPFQNLHDDVTVM